MLLKTWLKLLKDSGCDQVDYGKEEKSVLESPVTNREWHLNEFGKLPDFSKIYDLRLINFIYGLELDDWGFWFAPRNRRLVYGFLGSDLSS